MTKYLFSSHITNSIQRGLKHLKQGHFTVFLKSCQNRFYSHTLFFGLHRNLDKTFQPPNAEIDISIRPLQEGDIDLLLENGKFAKYKPRLAAYQQNLVHAKIPTCYVAVTADGEPCYMQWLIGPGENSRIQDYFGNTFPPLCDDEALLEGAFMRQSFRGLNIMPAAMARIAEKAKDTGIRRTLTFVASNNIPALKGCRRAGFSPYTLRSERWFFFRQSISFGAIPEDLMERYDQEVGGQLKYPGGALQNDHVPKPKSISQQTTD